MPMLNKTKSTVQRIFKKISMKDVGSSSPGGVLPPAPGLF
jgi:hypothetical protein